MACSLNVYKSSGLVWNLDYFFTEQSEWTNIKFHWRTQFQSRSVIKLHKWVSKSAPTQTSCQEGMCYCCFWFYVFLGCSHIFFSRHWFLWEKGGYCAIAVTFSSDEVWAKQPEISRPQLCNSWEHPAESLKSFFTILDLGRSWIKTSITRLSKTTLNIAATFV